MKKQIWKIQDASLLTRELRRQANAVARQAGHGAATHFLVVGGEKADWSIIDHVSYGYRKISTGEYVPNKYRSNFGWKNTYYQGAETTVSVPLSAWCGRFN